MTLLIVELLSYGILPDRSDSGKSRFGAHSEALGLNINATVR